MKKVLIFAAVLVLLFGAFAYINHISNAKNMEKAQELFNKTDLHPLTLKQLDNPNYQNQILPHQLEQAISDRKDIFVYFYKSDCQYCQMTAPVIVPLAEELGIDLKLLNLLEFPTEWDKYNIQGVPHIAYFKDGEKDANAIEGAILEDDKKYFIDWVNHHKRQ